MPAKSEKQRRYLNWKFGHEWVKKHHFDNKGKLPMRVGEAMHFKEWLLTEMPMISIAKDKTVLADDKPLKDLDVNALVNNIVFFRIPEKKRHIFAPGTTWVYFMDSEEAAKDMEQGKIPMLVVPQGTFSSGGSPITDVWKKKFAKPGTEKILGIIEGNSTKDMIYVNMMTVRPPYKRNSINTKMIQYLQGHFPKAKLTFSKPTPQGEKFIQNMPPTPK